MLNADLIVTRKTLRAVSALRFVGSRLITRARYLSGWSLPDLSEVWRIRGRCSAITVQPAGHLLLSRSVQGYQVTEIADGEVVSVCHVAEDRTRFLETFALSACGRFIIAGERGAVRVREASTGKIVWERKLERSDLEAIWPLHSGAQWALCIRPIRQYGEKRIPTTVEVWDWPLGTQPRSILERDAMSSLCTVNDAGMVAFPGSRSNPIRIFDLESGSAVQEFAPPAGDQHFGCAHWLSNDRLALAWENTLFLAKLNEPPQQTFSLPAYSVYSVAAKADLLAIMYHDEFVLVPLNRFLNSQATIEVLASCQDPPEHVRDSEDHSFVTPLTDSHRSVVGGTTAELRNELKELERAAWIPQVRFRTGEVTSSKLGGTPWLSQAEKWPCCGVCSRPMELFLQLNSDDLPGEMADRFEGLLQVFLCVTDGYSSGTCALGYEGFSKAAMLRLCTPVGPSRYQYPPFDDAFIEGVIESWQPRVDLPSTQELAALGIDLSDEQLTLMLDSTERLVASGDKLGGWPNWQQNVEYISCSRCKRRMDVIFQFDTDYTLPHSFMDGGTAWVSQCRDHPDVLALNWNS
jgi:uncharacterized protein YwqG